MKLLTLSTLRRTSLMLIVTSCAALFSLTAQADDDKAILSRLNFELAAMDQLIASAQRAPKAAGSRLTFSYSLLRADLEKIKRGIQTYLNSETTLPRDKPVIPLNGKYTE